MFSRSILADGESRESLRQLQGVVVDPDPGRTGYGEDHGEVGVTLKTNRTS